MMLVMIMVMMVMMMVDVKTTMALMVIYVMMMPMMAPFSGAAILDDCGDCDISDFDAYHHVGDQLCSFVSTSAWVRNLRCASLFPYVSS